MSCVSCWCVRFPGNVSRFGKAWAQTLPPTRTSLTQTGASGSKVFQYTYSAESLRLCRECALILMAQAPCCAAALGQRSHVLATRLSRVSSYMDGFCALLTSRLGTTVVLKFWGGSASGGPSTPRATTEVPWDSYLQSGDNRS